MKKEVLFYVFMLFTGILSSQKLQQDTIPKTDLESVTVSATRVRSDLPFTFSQIDAKDIAPINLGQDMPILLDALPSVVITSDAGNGIGYTGLRVRGTDATRINVTINGIPYNDAESQTVFWVNISDFASSVNSIQLQRGVGASTNGASAFGATLSLETTPLSEGAYAEISNSFGSFNTFKHSAKFSTGKLKKRVEFSGRLSQINSDGYIARASSNLQSYFLQGGYKDKRNLIKLIGFGGKEKTYQAWYGIDKTTLETNRKANFAGAYTDKLGHSKFYDNQTDNYWQQNYQLIWNSNINENWTTAATLHLTQGKGYYEEYQDDANLFAETALKSFYNIDPITVKENIIDTTDLVRQKWLENDFYGLVFSANYKKNGFSLTTGSGWNKYEGDHFGKVIWARNSDIEKNYRYYNTPGNKRDFNIYSKVNYTLGKLTTFLDMQYRDVSYKANVTENTTDKFINNTYQFFNPKIGLNYQIGFNNRLYASLAIANREPSRADLLSGESEAERLLDYEIGWRVRKEHTAINVNGYYMAYQNQLVLTGERNDVGSLLRENIGTSYRTGIEIDATFRVLPWMRFSPNIALSSNKNIDYVIAPSNSTEYKDTDISFTPNVIIGNNLSFSPSEGLVIQIVTKYVGDQFMSNANELDSKLASFTYTNATFDYQLPLETKNMSLRFNLIVNNLFDAEYVSNGYYSSGYAGYFPQASINIIGGATIRFW